MQDFLRSQTENTRVAYRQDLLFIARVLGFRTTAEHPRGSPEKTMGETKTLEEFSRWLFTRTPVEANSAVVSVLTEARAVKAAAATVNRRLAALRSLLRLARSLGMVTWSIEIKGVRGGKRREMHGPEIHEVKQLLTTAKAQLGARGARDLAILSLLFMRALRSVEVRELDLEHVNLIKRKLLIRAKGASERTSETIPIAAVAALREWLKWRGDQPGPLFISFDSRRQNGRIPRSSFWRLVKELGEASGIEVRPHGLRHTAITKGLDLTNGDVRTVRAFSRHAQVQTVMDYDDARTDAGGDIADRVAALLDEK